MIQAAVIGSPVAHSLSPAMHRAAYAALGLTDWRYEAIDVDAEELPAFVARLGKDWAGLSVTMPGKAAAAAVADLRSARVRMLGVANTLVPTEAGWAAENTDVDGVIGALGAAGVGKPVRGLLVGGGGTGLAAIAALAEMGLAEIVIAGRRPQSTEPARRLADSLGIHAVHVSMDAEAIAAELPGVDVAIATVPAGAADHLAIVLAQVPLLFDAIYYPWPTPLAAAGGPDRVTVTGLDMLLHQAFRQVEMMTGLPAPREEMRDALRRAAGVDLPLPLGHAV